MNEKIIIAVVAICVGGVIGHYGGSLISMHVTSEGDMDMNMSENMSMDMTADKNMNMNPDGLPIGIHNHPLREIDKTKAVPSLDVEAIKDSMGGYNFRLTPMNFTMAPEKINTEPVPNEGHAHIFVNGEKVARIYGEWFNVSGKYFTKDVNKVEITLNASDHSEWVVDGVHLGATLQLIK